MKHADTLNPTETLYESRFFEAFHQVQEDGFLTGAKLLRQVRIRCKGCFFSDSEYMKPTPHRRGKLWIVDFYIWPKMIVEVDGHDVRGDRNECLQSRGLVVHHIQNRNLYEMEEAVGEVHIMESKWRAVRDLRLQYHDSSDTERSWVAMNYGLLSIAGSDQNAGWAFKFMAKI